MYLYFFINRNVLILMNILYQQLHLVHYQMNIQVRVKEKESIIIIYDRLHTNKEYRCTRTFKSEKGIIICSVYSTKDEIILCYYFTNNSQTYELKIKFFQLDMYLCQEENSPSKDDYYNIPTFIWENRINCKFENNVYSIEFDWSYYNHIITVYKYLILDSIIC